MTQSGDEKGSAERLDDLIARLLRDRHWRIDKRDLPNQEAVRMAAFLAGVRVPNPRLSYRRRRRLGNLLEAGDIRRLISRRELIATGITSAAGFTGGLMLGRLVPESSTVAKGHSLPATLEPTHGSWVDVGSISDLDARTALRVQAGAVPAFVFLDGTQPTAVSAICSHLPCELLWDEAQQQLLCPCHQRRFTRSGTAVGGLNSYPLPPLTRILVRTHGRRLQVLGTDG